MTEFSIPPEFDFGQQFDRVTLTRAMALQPERALLAMQIDGPALLTRVRGSGTNAYEQRIELPVDRRLGLKVEGECSCPVGYNCKHVAAALMAFEAFQIRRERSPASAPAATVSVVNASPAKPSAATAPAVLPHALLAWLAELDAVSEAAAAPEPLDLATADVAVTPTRQLLYVLRPQATRLQLQLYLGNLRRNGEVGTHRVHSPTVTDMLRTQPGYLRAADQPVLATLLPLAAQSQASFASTIGLHGPRAGAALRVVLGSGRAWLMPNHHDALPTPPGAPARWLDAPLTISLQWHADDAGQWRTRWRDAAGRNLRLVLLPEPLALDPVAGTVQPALIDTASPKDAVADWLGRMPPVAPDLLPQFVDRLQTLVAARSLSVPMPQAHARQVVDLGNLPLVPMLRLSTCPDVASEALLQPGYGTTAARLTKLRQASIQLVFRYESEHAPAVDFHFPAGAADKAIVAQPDRPALSRFERQTEAESAALNELLTAFELRPWSLSAGLAFDRLSRLGARRLQSSVVPPALAGKPLVLVPQHRDQWPRLLGEQLPALEARGWVIEAAADFPYELRQPDDWALDIQDEEGADDADAGRGGDWFKVGLKVTVDGKAVNLVPLLVGLVQSGRLEQATGVADGDVLVPWPSEEPPVPGQMPRQRLLRLPLQRVAPLLDWLRAVFWKGNGEGPLRLSRFDLGTLEALASDGRVTAPPSFTELIAEVAVLRGGQGLPPVAVPSGVRATLRHYQQDGLAWMDFLRRARLGGVLADDMGLGKTLQALALLQAELAAGRLDRPCLVVVPTSLIGNWQSEAARFTPELKLLLLHGPQRAQQFRRIAEAHLVITSYPLAVRDIDVLAAQPWHYVLLDEAQRIKNSRSQAAITLKGLQARHRLCLSGTPLENHLGEVWSLMDFVCPGLLGNEAQFREHYRNPIEKQHDTAVAENLARRVRPFILRRTKQQVARELPEKTETLLRVELGGGQADLYETVRATMDKKLRDAIAKQGLARSQIMVLDALLKLRQVCCDPRLLKTGEPVAANARSLPSAKMELLLDLLPTLVEDGRRVLLFSQFTEMLALIEPELTKLKLPYVKLTGETRDRAAVVAEFQQGEVPLFLISLKAGGVGLNLTAADTVILYDPWWNPAVEQQAIDRAYRIGQDKPVFVYKLLASGTVEDKMLELQARKAGLADLLLSGVASDAALNPQDFDELFKPLGSTP